MRGAADDNHEIPHFVPGVGVAVCLDDLVYRKRAADDRSKLAAFDERLEEFEVGLHRDGRARQEDSPADNVGPKASHERGDDGEDTVREADQKIAAGFSARRLPGNPALPITSQTTS